MRKGFLIFLVTCALAAACDEVDDLLTFTISDETEFTVESTSPLNLPIEVGTPPVTTNSNQKFENNNTAASLVKDIRLEEVRLTVVNPSNKTFSFMKSVQIFISTNQNNEIELASLNDFPTNVSTVLLTTTDEKLDEYVKASSYNLRTRVVTRESLSQPVDIKINLKFKVTAAPL